VTSFAEGIQGDVFAVDAELANAGELADEIGPPV
jgi:hypothetical protein